MLERLYVDNYRCLVNFECRFSRKQLVLGPNGSGKTTVLNALATVRDFCVNGVPAEPLFVGATLTRWQHVPEQTFELDVAGNGGSYTLRLVVDSWGQPTARARVVKEEVFFSGRPIFRFASGQVHLFTDEHVEKVKYPFDWFRSALATITERPENTKLTWFKRWLGGVLLIMPDPHRMSPLAEKESPVPAVDLSNFAAWYRHLRLESGEQSFLEDLREAIPGFVRMDLKDAGMGNRVLQLTFSAEGGQGQSRQEFHQYLPDLSDGQRVLIGLYAVLHFALKPGATVLFDGAENFLALREIQPWLEKVLGRVEDDTTNSQLVFVSHHPELLNRLAFQDGIAFDRPGGRHTRVRRFEDPTETGLSPAELVARGWENE
jgi:hypothetical protein